MCEGLRAMERVDCVMDGLYFFPGEKVAFGKMFQIVFLFEIVSPGVGDGLFPLSSSLVTVIFDPLPNMPSTFLIRIRFI